MIDFKKRKKGFGLLEVLLAGVVVITIVGGLVFLGRTSMNNLTYLQQKSQATFLAQEGIEVVRQIRDTNYIDGDRSTGWNSFIGGSEPAVGSYYYFRITDTPSLSDDSDDEEVTLGGTSFERTVRFEQVSGDILKNPSDVNPGERNAYIATVTVNWDGSRGPVEIKELIADSRQRF